MMETLNLRSSKVVTVSMISHQIRLPSFHSTFCFCHYKHFPFALTVCVWGTWGEWSTCSKDCGSGIRQRSRSEFTPGSAGSYCPGCLTESEPCNTQACAGTENPCYGVSCRIIYHVQSWVGVKAVTSIWLYYDLNVAQLVSFFGTKMTIIMPIKLPTNTVLPSNLFKPVCQ